MLNIGIARGSVYHILLTIYRLPVLTCHIFVIFRHIYPLRGYTQQNNVKI